MASSKMIVTIALIGLVALTVTGCSSDSNPVATTTVDTAPPAMPVNVDLAYEAGSATVSWDANTVDADLAGYVVTRERYGVTTTLVATPSLITAYQDLETQPGSSMYHVYAVDQVGNQSAVASVNLTIALSKPIDERYE